MDASQEEIEYKWFEAAKSYEQILQSISGVAPFAAESWQRILVASTYASPREPFKTSISKLPARKVLPVLGLFTTTTAGAKMSESIL